MMYDIGGARASIEDHEAILKKAQSWGNSKECEVLIVDASVVFGRDHLETAIRHAIRGESAGTMVARTLSMEALRYLSGQRQVADAIRIAGIRRGTTRVAIAVFRRSGLDDLLHSVGWTRDDSVLDSAGKSVDLLGVTDTERGTVRKGTAADLALERVALLDVMK